MFRRCIALFLCLALTLLPLSVGAAEASPEPQAPVAENSAPQSDPLPSPTAEANSLAASESQAPLFPKINTFTGFSDTGTHWALSYIRLCYETGLMKGQGGNRFAPDVSISNGEVAMLAARIHAAIHGNSVDQNTQPWYKGAVDYLKALGGQTGSPNANATRQSFFLLLAAVVPDGLLPPINNITMLPDTRDTAVLKFYNAGILTGVDSFGTFDGGKPLTRGECAAMVARVAEPALRRHFIPAGQVPAGLFPADALVATVNEIPITFEDFSGQLYSLIHETHDFYLNSGLHFEWESNYGNEDWDWSSFFKSATLHSLSADLLVTIKATELNCLPDELALTLFGTPTRQELLAAAAQHSVPAVTPEDLAFLTDLVLEEKLSRQLNLWVEEAHILTTDVYDQLDARELWEFYGEPI